MRTIKIHFAKWGIVCLAVVVALASAGVTYARWSGQEGGTHFFDSGKGTRHGWWSNWWWWWTGSWSFSWSGNKCVETDSCDTEFIWVVSNDNGDLEDQGGHNPIDPGDYGGGTNYDLKWFASSSDDPWAPQAAGNATDRYDKDVARTTASIDSCDDHAITVLIENAYPSYYPTVFFSLKNNGNLQAQITSIIIDEDYEGEGDTTADLIDELTIEISGVSEGQTIDVGQETDGALQIHVEQCAEEVTTYEIRVVINFECVATKKCDTAYAYGGCEYATCFIGMDELENPPWGWTNGPLEPDDDEYEFPLYAGAAGCNRSKGERVGTVEIEYDESGEVEVEYDLKTPYTMDATHLYVGYEPLPRDDKGEFTVSPGKYPYTQTHEDATEYTYDEDELPDFFGDIYIIAHADVCGLE